MRSRRVWLVAGALLLALAPAGAAQSGAVVVRTFDDVPPFTFGTEAYPDITTDMSCEEMVEPDPASGEDDQALVTFCDSLTITFAAPQAQVSLRAFTQAGEGFQAAAVAPAVDLVAASGSDTIASDSRAVREGSWAALTVASPDGSAAIEEVTVYGSLDMLAIDDLAYATARQPDTTLAGGPPASTTSRDAAFSLGSPFPGASFECSLDGAEFAPCPTAPAYAGLLPGAHSFRARARDPYANVDPTPVAHSWTIEPAPPPALTPSGDPDGDGLMNADDNCPEAANRSQADEDRDELGNACEILPSGRLPVAAGVRTKVRVLSGEVLVKLPSGAGGARAAQLPPGFVPLKGIPFTPVDVPRSTGFVPLKGVATLPLGSTIDAREGSVALTSAASFNRRESGRARRVQRGRFSAAIFTIKQRRSRTGRTARRPATTLRLRTPPGDARACAAGATPPAKGIVRTLSAKAVGVAKGRFRAVGKASTTVVRRGTWVTQDRCDGTLTEVGRGRAKVRDRRAHRTVVVGPGRAYLARARLFAAKRRRDA